jgi:hypothetical protein
MRTVRLSLKHARALVSVLGGVTMSMHSVEADARFALEKAIRPRPVSSHRVRKERKRETMRERWAAVRQQVAQRAGPFCECGCGAVFSAVDPGESDHFFGRARAESVETVWKLSRACHRQKTANHPSAALWLRCFIAHCHRHGYHAEMNRAQARLEALQLVPKSTQEQNR